MHVPVHAHVCAPMLATDSISSTVLGLFMSLDSLGLVWGRDVSLGSCEYCPSVHLFGVKSFMVLNCNSYSLLYLQLSLLFNVSVFIDVIFFFGWISLVGCFP